MATGGCHCGAVRYRFDGEAKHHSICHCIDCRRAAGAPLVAWTDVEASQFRFTSGEPVEYASSPGTVRSFCGRCGTGLIYVNERMLPGIVAIQSGTLDEPEHARPELHVQDAERLGWTRTMDALPSFARYPTEPGAG